MFLQLQYRFSRLVTESASFTGIEDLLATYMAPTCSETVRSSSSTSFSKFPVVVVGYGSDPTACSTPCTTHYGSPSCSLVVRAKVGAIDPRWRLDNSRRIPVMSAFTIAIDNITAQVKHITPMTTLHGVKLNVITRSCISIIVMPVRVKDIPHTQQIHGDPL